MFTVKEFPGRRFATVKEYEEALKLRSKVEAHLAERSKNTGQPQKLVATIVPADPESLEQRLMAVESRLRSLEEQHTSEGPASESLPVATILRGESKGRHYTLEVLPDGYLCSDGAIYATLSAAALGVSGNRRSGWKFWKDSSGKPIGEVTGRFKSTCGA